jgi:hypothetical protein
MVDDPGSLDAFIHHCGLAEFTHKASGSQGTDSLGFRLGSCGPHHFLTLRDQALNQVLSDPAICTGDKDVASHDTLSF